MVNYYELLKKAAEEKTEKIQREIAKVEKVLAMAIKNLDKEQTIESGLKHRMETLKSNTDTALTSDALSFEGYKKSLRSLTIDLAVSEEALKDLNRIIPERRASLASLQKDLITTLRIVVAELVPIGDKTIGRLMDAAEHERLMWMDSVEKLHKDYDLPWIFNDERLIIGAWPAAESVSLNPTGEQAKDLEPPKPEIVEFKLPEPVEIDEPAVEPGTFEGCMVKGSRLKK